MNKLAKCAIIFGSVFLAFAIAGGICLGFGVAREYSDGNLSDSVSEFISDVTEYSESVDYDDEEAASSSVDRELTPDVKEIELRNFAAKITIVPVSSSDLKVEHAGMHMQESDGYYTFEPTSDRLVVTEHGEFFPAINFAGISFGNAHSFGNATVYIPESFSGRLTIDSSAGEMTFDSLTLDELVINNAAGEMNINNCVIGKLTCDNAAAEVNASGSISGIDISDNLGEFNISSKVPFTVPCSITNSIGEVNIRLPQDSRLNINSSNALGEVDVEGSIRDSSGTDFRINNAIGEIEIELDD